MGNKKIPDEVATAMELAEAAGWKVSNRNKAVVITIPDAEHPTNMTIGYYPNDESMKVFRSNARTYNLIGQGPARTPSQTKALLEEAERRGQKEADAINAKRRAYEAEQKAKQAAIEAARAKANAAIQRGMNQNQETSTEMPATPSTPTDLFPAFDAALLGTKVSSAFLLENGRYYCIECWETGKRSTFSAPQGLSAHRGVRHNVYGDKPTVTDEHKLPADIETALDMVRAAITESLDKGGDPAALAERDAEIETLREQVAKLTKEADADRKANDRRFEEVNTAADKALKDAAKAAEAKREAEIQALMESFMAVLVEIQKAIESKSPIQAVAEIDTILTKNLKK